MAQSRISVLLILNPVYCLHRRIVLANLAEKKKANNLGDKTSVRTRRMDHDLSVRRLDKQSRWIDKAICGHSSLGQSIFCQMHFSELIHS